MDPVASIRSAYRPDDARGGSDEASAATAFEAMVLSTMVEDMLMSAAPEGDPLGSSLWRGMFAQAIGEEIAAGGRAPLVQRPGGRAGRYAGGGDW